VSKARLIRLLLALTILATAGWLLRDYTTDDTYIHLRYARNLLDHGEFSFNPGDAVYGATSPLWVFVLALFLKLGLAPVTAAWLAGALSGLLVVLLVDALLSRLTFPDPWKAAGLVVITADAWFLRWTFSGMETPLATALLLVLLWPLVSGRDMAWGKGREPLWQRYLAWGVAAGMVGLVRPEFLLVAPLALPWLLWFEYFRVGATGTARDRARVRPHGPALAAGVGWLLVTVPWFVYAWTHFGRFFPGTATAKSQAATGSFFDVLPYLMQALQQLAATQGLLWLTALALIGLVLVRNSVAGRDDEAAWFLPSPTMDDDLPERAPGAGPWSVWGPVALVGIAATWTMALLGGYAVKQVWSISRYVSPLAPVLVLAMGVVAEWLVVGVAPQARDRTRYRVVIGTGAFLTLATNAWLLTAHVVPHARSFRAGIDTCYVGMGAWLRDNTPEDAVIAALDIGAVGWTSERRVLDLMGLVSPEIMDLGRGMGFTEMIESGVWLRPATGARPTWLVDRCEGEPRWQGRTVGGVTFELVDTCILRGVGLREPQPWTVALYRLVSGDNRVKSSSVGGSPSAETSRLTTTTLTSSANGRS
jgi:hypothetical protein